LDRLADRKAPSRPNGSTAEASAVQAAERQDVGVLGPQAVSLSEQPRVKATFYLSREDVLVIDRLQSTVFMQTGKKPERSLIVSQALQLLAGEGKS